MSHDTSPNEYKLANCPTEVIQSVKFGPTDSQHLLTASWDMTVRLYDVVRNQQRCQYTHDAPVLDVAFQGSSVCWSGGCDNKVNKFDFHAEQKTTIGFHNDAVRSVEYVSDVGLIATGSWDKYLKLWDPRTSDSSNTTPILSSLLPDKVYSMSACGEKLIVGTAGRRILIWDLRNFTHIQRESPLRYQTRQIAAFADQKGYVVTSIEGRVAIEYLDPSPEVQKQRYAFKCHRNKDPATGFDLVYPVNAVSFHKRYNTFATGGSDGFVSVWDGRNKKRLIQFHRYPTSISSLSFSPDGSSLAIASSYLHGTGEADTLRDIPPDTIYIRRIGDNEVRGKGMV